MLDVGSLMMMRLLSKLFFLASIKNVLIMATEFFDSSPGCFDFCSNQVNCTISYGFCGSGTRLNLSQGPDIAAEPVDLKVDKQEDGVHQYINLKWRPPKDGSYNYLTGFLVQVTMISLDPVHTGVRGTTCYRVLPASDWYKTHKSLHRRGGVVFFLNCLRFPAHAIMDLVISIHSLPLNSEEPKLAMTKVSIEPADIIMWNPRFDKWADSDDVMHLVIKNPLREACYYGIQIKSVDRDMMVFSHVFSAQPDIQSGDQLYKDSKNGFPHFLIPGLSKDDNYSILMDVLDANKTAIPHMRSIRTNPFKLNFTGLALATSSPSHHGFDNRFIIIVSVVVIVAVAVLVCLIWKGVFRPSKLRNWVRNCAVKKNSKNRHRNTSFLPIYCQENEHFISAVENHVSLLQRCLESQSAKSSSQSGIGFCCSKDHPMVEANNKSCDIIIYLSPRLGEILKLGPTCPTQCSRLDASCHQALQSLAQGQVNGQGAIPILVTFDCFHQRELTYLDDLMAFIFPPQLGETGDLSTPVRLASLDLGRWKVENVDVLYLRLSRHPDFTPNTSLSLQGWRDCEETKAVERHLSLLCEAENRGTKDFTVSWERDRFAASPKLEFTHFPSNIRRSMDDLDRSYPDRLDQGHEECGLGNNREDMNFSPNSPLLFNSSGFQSLSEARSSNNSLHRDIQPNNSLKSVGPRFQVQLPTPGALTKDAGNYRPLNYHSPTGPRDYRQKDSNEIPDSVLSFQGRQSLHTDGVVKYTPNVFSNDVDSVHSSSVNSVDSESVVRTNDLNGYVRRRDQFPNEELGNNERVTPKSDIRLTRPNDIIVPPSLSHSNFTSMESVCERINRVNEHSGWNQRNLSK